MFYNAHHEHLQYLSVRGVGRVAVKTLQHRQGDCGAHKDRLARFGSELLAHLCEPHDCQIVVLNTEALSPEQEMVQDLMTIIHDFSSRLYGLRNYRRTIQKALQDGQGAQDTAQSHA